ncbi:Gfo/Idh/MocA family oxidoreductase [Estrella lausannensis]|uniref:NAD-dependent oxidoreductase n=1 Tax=Estrella lausannensis TaxID=483423 RepID=A0A0H5DQG3_9BACT|nr:Gfo/Idh/MocA family oxidoreductase [Estrella lausannensis]CRX38767.1 NAD-dependent oxidoreductase [Estrella lausannensis]
MNENLKPSLALIGGGRWGKNLLRNFHSLGVLHTLCDANEKLLDSYQSQYPGVRMTASLHSVMHDPAIDKVAIAAPALMHFQIAKEALMCGKDVFVEKPICMNVQEGEELIRLAQERGKILMVGHILQYHPAIHKLEEMVGRGELGKLQYIASNRLNLGAFRTEENALWNFAPHDISVILSLAGNRLPEEVRCTGGNYISQGVADTTMTTMTFDQELKAHIYVSWLHPFKEQKLVVIGSHGMAVFDDTKPIDEKLAVFRNYVRWSQGSIPEVNSSQPEFIPLALGEPLKAECQHFLNCCQERISPKTDGIEGLRVLKVLEAAQLSLESSGEKFHPKKLPVFSFAKPSYFAHESACVDDTATVGHDTKIWHFSHIMKGATIGDRCSIGQNVVVSPAVSIGSGVKIQNNVSIYTGVTVEEDVFIGPSAVFTNVINPRSPIPRKNEFKPTVIKQGATIGANSTIICGITIGRFSFVGAGAVVTKDVPPYALVVGNPAKQTGWMSRAGYKLPLPLKTPQGETLSAKCPGTGEEYLLEGALLRERENAPKEEMVHAR